MKILVCGGRDYEDWDVLAGTLDELRPTIVVHGCARGADQLADKWAVTNYIPVIRFPALWNIYGSAAGAIRNKEMLEISKPDVVIAFKGGKGTANMVALAKKAGVKVIEA